MSYSQLETVNTSIPATDVPVKPPLKEESPLARRRNVFAGIVLLVNAVTSLIGVYLASSPTNTYHNVLPWAIDAGIGVSLLLQRKRYYKILLFRAYAGGILWAVVGVFGHNYLSAAAQLIYASIFVVLYTGELSLPKLKVAKRVLLPLTIVALLAAAWTPADTASASPILQQFQSWATFGTSGRGQFASQQDNFTIGFPGSPKVTHVAADNSTWAFTSYQVTETQRGQFVYVFDIPGSAPIDDQPVLSSSLKEIATDGLTVQSSSSVTFRNLPALDARLLVTASGAKSEMYLRGLIYNRKMYLIWTVGDSKASFDSFVQSFQFTQ
jgi:hypothetical protein